MGGRRKRGRGLLTGWLWYLGMLTPMIGIVQAGAFAQADRIDLFAADWDLCGGDVAGGGVGAKWHMGRVALGVL